MKIKWLERSSFLITAANGTKVLTDPYASKGELSAAGEIKESADVVTVSHEHWDHSNVSAVRGNPEVVRSSAEVKGIAFKAISAFHDDSGGSKRGANTIFCMTIDGVRLCHLGDLGQQLTAQQVAEIGGVDILMLPVGGFFTIDAVTATEVIERLKPKIAIPMHFATKKASTPISGIEAFISAKKNVKQPDSSEAEFTRDSLPAKPEVLVLKPAL